MVNTEMTDYMLYGMKIIVNELLQETFQTIARVHTKYKDTSYHKRIQKKWIKRYGYQETPYILKSDGCLYMHPNTVKLLRDKMISKW